MMRQEVGYHEHHERLRSSISTVAKVSCIGKIFTEKFVFILQPSVESIFLCDLLHHLLQ